MKFADIINREDVVVHCDTIDKAITLLKKYEKYGILWVDDTKPTSKNISYTYSNQTCYRIVYRKLTFADVGYYIEKGYKIIKFDEILFDD